MSVQRMTVREAVDEFLEVKDQRAPGYVRDLTLTLTHFAEAVGPIQARNLTYTHVSKVFDAWALAGNSPGTYNKKLGHVAQWLKFAHQRGRIKQHPKSLMSGVISRRVIARKRLYLNAHQLLAVLDAAHHPRDRAYLACAMNTALRAQEIATLRVDDLDLDNGWIHVLRHKTGERDVIPVTADLEAELRIWLTFYAQRVTLEKTHFLFPAKNPPLLARDGAGYDIDVAAAVLRPTDSLLQPHIVLKRLLEEAGVWVPREGLHTVRRSMARLTFEHLILEGGEARDEALCVVQAMLGHATQAITEKYIGVERFKAKRDLVLRGKPLLTAMIGDMDNVRRLHG